MKSLKQGMLQAIEAWQQNPDRTRGMCVHTPTCSVYGHRAITRYGLFRGGFMTIWQVLRCNRCLTPGLPNDRSGSGHA